MHFLSGLEILVLEDGLGGSQNFFHHPGFRAGRGEDLGQRVARTNLHNARLLIFELSVRLIGFDDGLCKVRGVGRRGRCGSGIGRRAGLHERGFAGILVGGHVEARLLHEVINFSPVEFLSVFAWEKSAEQFHHAHRDIAALRRACAFAIARDGFVIGIELQRIERRNDIRVVAGHRCQVRNNAHVWLRVNVFASIPTLFERLVDDVPRRCSARCSLQPVGLRNGPVEAVVGPVRRRHWHDRCVHAQSVERRQASPGWITRVG